jgi:hypothetical protein
MATTPRKKASLSTEHDDGEGTTVAAFLAELAMEDEGQAKVDVKTPKKKPRKCSQVDPAVEARAREIIKASGSKKSWGQRQREMVASRKTSELMAPDESPKPSGKKRRPL